MLCLPMRKNPLLQNGHLTASNTLKKIHPALHLLKHLNVHEIGSRKSMLRDQHRLLVTGKLRNDVGRFALQRCHKLGSHAVTLK